MTTQQEAVAAGIKDLVDAALEHGVSPAALGLELITRGVVVMTGLAVPIARELTIEKITKGIAEVVAIINAPPAGSA